MMRKIAVILFPGTNCENETALAVRSVCMDAKIFRWNRHESLEEYDGFVIPGGWSYEDRIRAGVISSKDPIMEKIKKQAMEGKPVLGICNGCQVLVEAKLVPNLKNDVEMALAPNVNPFISGYYCTWVYIKNMAAKKTAFNLCFEKNEIIQIPIAHAEGCFTTKDFELLDKMEQNDQIAFKYCNEKGEIAHKFPINPNGAIENIAGIYNKNGNILAMMPHPERASWKRQLPGFEGKPFSDMNSAAQGRKIFESMKLFIEGKR